jgi:hypothetical protein
MDRDDNSLARAETAGFPEPSKRRWHAPSVILPTKATETSKNGFRSELTIYFGPVS